MGRGPDRDEAELLVFDADAPPTRPAQAGRPGTPGGRRRSSRGIGIAVAALVVLTGGVVIGGILESPGPDGNPRSDDPPSCIPTGLDSVPTFRVGVDGSPLFISGQLGSNHVPATQGEDNHTWRVPAPGAAAQTPSITTSDVLEARVDGGRCIRYLVAERAWARLTNPGARDRTPMVDGVIAPASYSPALGTLPEGDWVIRVTAFFETGVGDVGGLVTGERYFRVRVGDGPFSSGPPPPTKAPRPSPGVTPALPCGVPPTAAEGVRIDLTAPGSGPVAGAAEGGDLPVVNVGLGDQIELAIADDACALSWSLTILDLETGDTVQAETVLNPNDLPEVAHQNRWPILVPNGAHDLVATFHFGPGIDVVRFWRVVGLSFDIPTTSVTAEDGSTVNAVPICGLSVELANGYSAGDDCGGFEVPQDLPVLRVPAWSRIVVEVPGWTITSWNGQCGRTPSDGGGGTSFEYLCSLGGYYVEDGLAPPGPAQFIARPGDQAVQVFVSATNETGRFSVPMMLRVVGE